MGWRVFHTLERHVGTHNPGERYDNIKKFDQFFAMWILIEAARWNTIQ